MSKHTIEPGNALLATKDELNEKLRQLMAEACTHPAGSLERQPKINHVYRLGRCSKQGYTFSEV